MKTILITGINGFIGSSLYNLLNEDYTIIGMGRTNKQNINNFVYCDLSNSESTSNAENELNNYKIDAIIHTASKIALEENVRDINVLIENIKIAENVAILTKKLKIEYFINFSSSSVYPNVSGDFTEQSIIWPAKNSDCYYGLSKFNAENIITYHLESTLKHLLHLRISSVYGSGMNENRIIGVFKREIINTNKLTIWGSGERIINLIEIKSLCSLINHFLNNPISGVVNISKESLTLLELGKKMILEYGNPTTQMILLKQGEDNKFLLNINKLNKLIKDE